MKKIPLALALALAFTSTQAAEASTALQQAIAGKHRSAEHKARDKYRHPEQTLDFFEVKNDMTVVEIWPSGI